MRRLAVIGAIALCAAGRVANAEDPRILENVPDSPQIATYEAKTKVPLEKLLEGEAIDEMIRGTSGRNILQALQSRRTECGGFISYKDGAMKLRLFDDPTDEPLHNAMKGIEKKDFSGYDLLMKGLEIRKNSSYLEASAMNFHIQVYMTSMMNDLLLMKQLSKYTNLRYDAYDATWKSLRPRLELEVVDSMFFNNLTMAKIEAISNEETILCFYHSHPMESGPSPTDMRLSKEDFYYKSFGVNAVISKITDFNEKEKDMEGVHTWVYNNGEMVSEKRHLMKKLPPPKRIK